MAKEPDWAPPKRRMSLVAGGLGGHTKPNSHGDQQPYDELGRYAGPGEGNWSEKSGEEKYGDLSGRLVLTQSGPGQQNRRTLEKGAHLPELHDWPSGIDQHGRILCKDGTLCKTDPRDMFPKTENVRDKNLDPRITSQYETIGRIFKEHGAEVVITSANDSKHMQNSLHYKNLAIDIRGKKILLKR